MWVSRYQLGLTPATRLWEFCSRWHRALQDATPERRVEFERCSVICGRNCAVLGWEPIPGKSELVSPSPATWVECPDPIPDSFEPPDTCMTSDPPASDAVLTGRLPDFVPWTSWRLIDAYSPG